jgi:hypothetical protein
VIYLLHATVPLHRSNGVVVQHYLGQCMDERLLERLKEHQTGRSRVSIVREFKKHGATLQLVAMWPGGTRDDERRLKNERHYKDRCTVCTPGKDREHGWTGTARVYHLPGWSRRHSKKRSAIGSATAITFPANEATGRS